MNPKASPPKLEAILKELEEAQTERDRLLETEAEIMKLLGTTSRENILHDLRNVLNDLVLLQQTSSVLLAPVPGGDKRPA
jgi:hypothetical protein